MRVVPDGTDTMLSILLAIVANVSLDEVATPLSVIAFAINILPLLTDVFKDSRSLLYANFPNLSNTPVLFNKSFPSFRRKRRGLNRPLHICYLRLFTSRSAITASSARVAVSFGRNFVSTLNTPCSTIRRTESTA